MEGKCEGSVSGGTAQVGGPARVPPMAPCLSQQLHPPREPVSPLHAATVLLLRDARRRRQCLKC